jgi:hypothetical protein
MSAPDLTRRLKRLRLGGLPPPLPGRATAARQGNLSRLAFLARLRQDESDRRDRHGLATRVAAGFAEVVSREQLQWLEAHAHIVCCDPAGVGQTVPACALSSSACRAGARVRFVKHARRLQALPQSRADNSFERELRSWGVPDLLVMDAFGRLRAGAGLRPGRGPTRPAHLAVGPRDRARVPRRGAPCGPCRPASCGPRRASFIGAPSRRRPVAMSAPDLARRLKRLRLGGLLPTLADRATAAASRSWRGSARPRATGGCNAPRYSVSPAVVFLRLCSRGEERNVGRCRHRM